MRPLPQGVLQGTSNLTVVAGDRRQGIKMPSSFDDSVRQASSFCSETLSSSAFPLSQASRAAKICGLHWDENLRLSTAMQCSCLFPFWKSPEVRLPCVWPRDQCGGPKHDCAHGYFKSRLEGVRKPFELLRKLNP